LLKEWPSIKLYCLAIIVAAAFITAAVTVDRAISGSLPYAGIEVASSTPSIATSTVDVPDRLVVTTLGIDAKIQQTGITAKGTMGIPTNFTDVAWYKYGSKPGEPGIALIDGHVDNGLALAGVFKNLEKINVSDAIDVYSLDGAMYRFKVVEIKKYPYASSPPELFTTKGPPMLALITCTGSWIRGARTYSERLVVTARLVN
jgi:sortase A